MDFRKMGSPPRIAVCILAGLACILSASPVLADSISPVSVSGTLAVGASATVVKTVTISAGTPTGALVDVYFLADTTGSMGSVIGSVATSASAILASTTGLGSVDWAVGEYKDFGDSYAYRLNQAVTSSQSLVEAGIGMWSASGGGDYQEADLYALYQLATQSATGWRTGSTRILVWFGDASGHDPSGGVTLANAETALEAANIKAEVLDVGALNDTGQGTGIATATGGAYYSGINSSSIVTAIQNGITTSFATYRTTGLDLSEAGPCVSVSSTPTSYTGSYSRDTTNTFTYDVTFTGVTPGTCSFNIYATVDGGRVATESDSFTVGTTTVPEPASLLLLGTGLVGAFRAHRKRQKK